MSCESISLNLLVCNTFGKVRTCFIPEHWTLNIHRISHAFISWDCKANSIESRHDISKMNENHNQNQRRMTFLLCSVVVLLFFTFGQSKSYGFSNYFVRSLLNQWPMHGNWLNLSIDFGSFVCMDRLSVYYLPVCFFVWFVECQTGSHRQQCKML